MSSMFSFDIINLLFSFCYNNEEFWKYTACKQNLKLCNYNSIFDFICLKLFDIYLICYEINLKWNVYILMLLNISFSRVCLLLKDKAAELNRRAKSAPEVPRIWLRHITGPQMIAHHLFSRTILLIVGVC